MFAKGLNQAQLAEKLGISRSAISQFVHEKRCQSRQVISKMANVLSVSIDLLMGKSPKTEFAELLQNDKIHALVMKFSSLSVTDQERIMDILDLLEQTTVKKSTPKKPKKRLGRKQCFES
jgi:transcriptional regulator with XRE-family HTH domain